MISMAVLVVALVGRPAGLSVGVRSLLKRHQCPSSFLYPRFTSASVSKNSGIHVEITNFLKSSVRIPAFAEHSRALAAQQRLLFLTAISWATEQVWWCATKRQRLASDRKSRTVRIVCSWCGFSNCGFPFPTRGVSPIPLCSFPAPCRE